MLVMTRKEGERILIGDNVWVMVVRAGLNVRIGIEAPQEVPILREEHVDPAKQGLQKYLTSWRRARSS